MHVGSESSGSVIDTTFVVSETLKHSNDPERFTVLTSYTKLKEILLNCDLPVCRVKFRLACDFAGFTVYGRVYKNGVAIGTERSQQGTAGTTYSEDFSGFKSGDLIQIYGKSDGVRRSENANFRFYWTYTATEIDSVAITTPIPLTAGTAPTNQDP